MNSESVGNESVTESNSKIVDDEIPDQVAIAEHKNTEETMEVTEENEEKGSDDTTNGNNETSTSENGNQNDVPADMKENNSALESKHTDENHENMKNSDESKPEVVESSDPDRATIDAAEVAVVDGNASEQGNGFSNEDASGGIAQKAENTEKVEEVLSEDKNNLEPSKSEEDNTVNEVRKGDGKNGDEQVENNNGGVDDVKIDDETKNNDEEKRLTKKDDEDGGNKDEEKPAASTPDGEIVVSEETEKKEDECHSETVGEEKIDNDGAGEENKVIKQDERKEDEIAVVDDGNRGDERHAETLVETPIEKRAERDNSGNDEVLLEKQNENSSAVLITKGIDEKDEKDSSENTAADEEAQEKTSQKDENITQENEDEIASGTEANLEDNRSQISRQDDNKSEVPSENIDDLVDEILAVTDDVDAGRKSGESETNANSDKPEVTDEGGSEKREDDDKPMITSESLEKNEGGETGKQVEETSSVDVHVNDAKDSNQGKHADQRQRAASGNTVYRVQTDYLTRQVIAKQEKEMYLEEKLNETTRDLETAERKVKDLQLRLKRFVKDDEAKDQKMKQMEIEYKELADHMQRFEESIKSRNNNIGEVETEEKQRKKSSSKVCVIL